MSSCAAVQWNRTAKENINLPVVPMVGKAAFYNFMLIQKSLPLNFYLIMLPDLQNMPFLFISMN